MAVDITLTGDAQAVAPIDLTLSGDAVAVAPIDINLAGDAYASTFPYIGLDGDAVAIDPGDLLLSGDAVAIPPVDITLSGDAVAVPPVDINLSGDAVATNINEHDITLTGDAYAVFPEQLPTGIPNPQRPCAAVLKDCECEEDPVSNHSSEENDPALFCAVATFTLANPPLGFQGGDLSATASACSEISQEDAYLAALLLAQQKVLGCTL